MEEGERGVRGWWVSFLRWILQIWTGVSGWVRKVVDRCRLFTSGRQRHRPDIQYILHAPEESSGAVEPDALSSESERKDSRCSSVSSMNYQYIEERRASLLMNSKSPPVVDVRNVEFWSGMNKELVQPRWKNLDFSQEEIEQLKRDIGCCTSPSGEDESPFRLGRVQLSLHYDIPTEVLSVKVLEARELPQPVLKDPSRADLAHSNPYAKVCLLPDHAHTRQTMVKRKTQDPVFGETFEFPVPFRDVGNRTLQVTLKDFDKFSRHCAIGQVSVPLWEVNFLKGARLWKNLLPCDKEPSDYGQIQLSVNYLPSAGRLTVDVIRAKQLLPTGFSSAPAPYVRVSLLHDIKVLKSKKTGYIKDTYDPNFHQNFSFHLAWRDLKEVSVVCTVCTYNGGISKDETIGRIVLGKYATGESELSQWQEMTRSPRTAVTQWHALKARSDCDLISAASRALL